MNINEHNQQMLNILLMIRCIVNIAIVNMMLELLFMENTCISNESLSDDIIDVDNSVRACVSACVRACVCG